MPQLQGNGFRPAGALLRRRTTSPRHRAASELLLDLVAALAAKLHVLRHCVFVLRWSNDRLPADGTSSTASAPIATKRA